MCRTVPVRALCNGDSFRCSRKTAISVLIPCHVRPSEWNIPAASERLFVKFCIGDIFFFTQICRQNSSLTETTRQLAVHELSARNTAQPVRSNKLRSKRNMTSYRNDLHAACSREEGGNLETPPSNRGVAVGGVRFSVGLQTGR